MTQYFATKNKDVYLKHDPASNTKAGRLQELDKQGLLDEKTRLESEIESKSVFTDSDKIEWFDENYPFSSEGLIGQRDIDRLAEIMADLAAISMIKVLR